MVGSSVGRLGVLGRGCGTISLPPAPLQTTAPLHLNPTRPPPPIPALSSSQLRGSAHPCRPLPRSACSAARSQSFSHLPVSSHGRANPGSVSFLSSPSIGELPSPAPHHDERFPGVAVNVTHRSPAGANPRLPLPGATGGAQASCERCDVLENGQGNCHRLH
jgi:hypothetical protein